MSEESSEQNKALHFLIVDDDAESRSIVVDYLKAMGYSKITEARDGSEAIRLIEQDTSINFVVSDWDMPLMNGFKLLQHVKADSARAHIPFVIMTSPVSEELDKVMMAAESLVDAYLIKPFRAQALHERINKALSSGVKGKQRQAVVVDDDADAREMVIEYLKAMGFDDVVSFPDGLQALDYLTSQPQKVGLIVSDWEMPEVSGLDLLKACKVHKALGDVPFLMITSQSSLERMKIMQAAKAKVDQYLLKPFTSKEMKKRVDQILERARTRVEVQSLIAEGQEHLARGRFPSAQIRFEEAISLDPDEEAAWIGSGDANVELKGWQAAVEKYRKAVEISPVSEQAYLKLALAYEKLGWIEKAVALLTTANIQVGFSAELHFQLGRFYNLRSLFIPAREELEKALAIQPDHAGARLLLNGLK